MSKQPVPLRGTPGRRMLTPQEQRALQQHLAQGGQLPPGYTALPEGQIPPPGHVPTGVTTNAKGGPVKPPEDLTTYNPIQADDTGISLMRDCAECPLPNETTLLQQHMQLLAQIKSLDEEAADIIANGLASYMLVNNFCGDNLKDRVAIEFEKDDELAALHAEVQARTREAVELQQKMHECHAAARAAIEKRWEIAVTKFGLNPAKNFYAIHEQDGTVKQLHLDCAPCRGKAKIRKARQAAGDYLAKVQAERRKQAQESAKPPAKEKE